MVGDELWLDLFVPNFEGPWEGELAAQFEILVNGELLVFLETVDLSTLDLADWNKLVFPFGEELSGIFSGQRPPIRGSIPLSTNEFVHLQVMLPAPTGFGLPSRPEAHVPRVWWPLSDNGEHETAAPRTHSKLRPERADLQVLSISIS